MGRKTGKQLVAFGLGDEPAADESRCLETERELFWRAEQRKRQLKSRLYRMLRRTAAGPARASQRGAHGSAANPTRDAVQRISAGFDEALRIALRERGMDPASVSASAAESAHFQFSRLFQDLASDLAGALAADALRVRSISAEPGIPALAVRVMRALVREVDGRDAYARGHSRQVADCALILAEELGSGGLDKIRLGAELRDIGKLGLPVEVLGRPGRLEQGDVRLVQSHTLIGATLLQSMLPDPDLNAIISSHHERWDGAGYPQGLKGEEIPVLARIVAVADTFTALISARPYRAAVDWTEAVREIESHAGSAFAPEAVQAFRAALPRLEARFATA